MELPPHPHQETDTQSASFARYFTAAVELLCVVSNLPFNDETIVKLFAGPHPVVTWKRGKKANARNALKSNDNHAARCQHVPARKEPGSSDLHQEKGLDMKYMSFVCIACVIFGLLITGCEQSQTPEQMRTALFSAVKKDDLATVQKLIRKGVDIKTPETPGGWSALHYAAQIGSDTIVKALLAAGADPDYVGVAPKQQGGTVFALKAKVVAQGGVMITRQAQSSPFLRFSSPEEEKRMKDPKTAERYQRTMELLEASTHP